MSLINSKKSLINAVLDLAWSQWSCLGVSGSGSAASDFVVDLEALLLLTCSYGGYDQRLFDEVVDWLNQQNQYLNLVRLKAITKKEGLDCQRVLAAIGKYFSGKKSGGRLPVLYEKYSHCNGEDLSQFAVPMFHTLDGKPIPVPRVPDLSFLHCGLIRNELLLSGKSVGFSPQRAESLQLSLRALFGVTARSEILLYSLVANPSNIKTISEQTYFAWRAVQEVVSDLGQIDVLLFPASKKHRVYSLRKEPFFELFRVPDLKRKKWICWPAFFVALINLLRWLEEFSDQNLSSRFVNTEFFQFYEMELSDRLTKAGLLSQIPVPRLGSELESFIEGLTRLLHSMQEITKD